jgi:glycosyltransferase involved in cell wall biosynthesis
MKITFFAALPPPVSGQSLTSQVLFREVSKTHDTDVVNFSKQSLVPGVNSLSRVLEVGRILYGVWKQRKRAQVIYFTISESFAGNIKDLLIYLLCFARLPRMVAHLQGGAGLQVILGNAKSVVSRANRYFIKRLGGLVVEGETQSRMFCGIIPDARIHIVPNFAEAYLFSSIEQIEAKYQNPLPLRILFLSNLIRGKGHNELLKAYLQLDHKFKARVILDFAGGFENPSQKAEFLQKINGLRDVSYHGIVGGELKKQLFARAHVFCLPTYYPYEGQPLSILEAYASGCVVITTNHSGIRDVFRDGINGYEVEKRSPESIAQAIRRVLDGPEELCVIALGNRKVAEERYTVNTFVLALTSIIVNTGRQTGML